MKSDIYISSDDDKALLVKSNVYVSSKDENNFPMEV